MVALAFANGGSVMTGFQPTWRIVLSHWFPVARACDRPPSWSPGSLLGREIVVSVISKTLAMEGCLLISAIRA